MGGVSPADGRVSIQDFVNGCCGEEFPAFGRFGINFAVESELEAGRGLKLAEGLDEFD